MQRAPAFLGVLVATSWLFGHATASAQTERCAAELASQLPELSPTADPDATACARVGGVVLGVTAEVLHATSDHAKGDEITLRLVTAQQAVDVSLGAALRRARQPRLGWMDAAIVSIAPVAGRPDLAMVSVVGAFGEDYASATETLVVVRLGPPPAVLWAGEGSSMQDDAGRCVRTRTVTATVRGGALHLRSRLSHSAAGARRCGPPRAVRVDVRL